jgi:GT2 family glycosyltransferase
VTVTYNSASVLPEFFDSLRAQTYREYTLYVIDNASSDGTLELCRRATDLPIVLVANDDNLGVAEGNNQGIRAALADGCEYVLLLNNDTVFDERLLAGLRDGLRQHGCGMTTPKIYYHGEPGKIWAAGGRFQRWLGYRPAHNGEGQVDRGQFDAVRTISYAPTCCVLIHRSAFERIGLMDPLYFVYSDDVDFMYRALKAGLVTKYLPGVTMQHKVNSLTGGSRSPFVAKYCTRNRVYFLLKNQPAVAARFWIAIYRGYLSLRFILRRDSFQVWDLKRAAVAEGWEMGRSSGRRGPAER